MTRRIPGPCGLPVADLKAKGYPSLPHIPEKASRHSIYVSREILSSRLFGYEKEDVAVDANGECPERTYYYKIRHYFTGRKGKGNTLKYTGPKLIQPHGTVLFHLALCAEGKNPGEDVILETNAFIKAIGWGEHADSRRRLWGVLKDLSKAHLTTSYVTEKERVNTAGTLLAHAEEHTPLPGAHGPISRILVSFSKLSLEIFRGYPVRLSLEKRARLTEGFETWIYGVLRATFARQEITYSYLYEIAGLTKLEDAKKEANRRKEFVRKVKAALKKMTTPKDGNKSGIFHLVQYTNRGFHLFKNSPTASDIREMQDHHGWTVSE